MTALNYWLQKENVMVFTDTLVSGSEFRPLKYTTKVFPLPHINSVICGVGNFDLLSDWYNYAHRKLVAEDISILDHYAAQQLPILDKKYGDAYSTIYQFGLDQSDNLYKGYVYRKEFNFKSQELEYSIALRPKLENQSQQVDEVLKNTDKYIEAYKRIMILQKEEQDKLPFKERTHIGGEIQYCNLNSAGIIMTTIHKFDDYNNMYKIMCSSLNK